MRIAVTGAAGRLGRYCVSDLVQAGHQVIALDMRPAPATGASAMTVDLTDAGQVYGALAGAQAVVHLGAWANAGLVPAARLYADNASGTFNVFQACADLGIGRVVAASSAQVYGFAGGSPMFAPADESHPLRPLNCYAASKIAGEEAARYFAAQHGLEIVSFRIMGARAPAEMDANVERIARHPHADTALLWTRTDARDVAAAARMAVEADTVASGPYNITGTEVVLEQSTCSLLEQYCPDCQRRDGLTGRASPLSCARAREGFGYQPRFCWSVQRRHPE